MAVEKWQLEYGRVFYLREMPDIALSKRLAALVNTLWSTDAAGNVVPTRNPANFDRLLRLICHTLIEQALRSGDENFRFEPLDLIRSASATYNPPRLKNPLACLPSGFAKFSTRSFIQDAFKHGILRIAPAAAYLNDPSLNDAQADNELLHSSVTPNESIAFTMQGYTLDGNKCEQPRPLELYRYLPVPNFYVWCCATEYDARMHQDFGDAALVIHDQAAFRARFVRAVRRQLSQAKGADGRLEYYDPYNVRHNQLRPIFSKDIAYLYQNEYRFAWKVPIGTQMPVFFVELGPLDDIAQIIEIEDTV